MIDIFIINEMSSQFYAKLMKQNVTYKVILVGYGGVGKSSMMIRYISNKFTFSMTSTTGIDYMQKKFRLKDKNVRLELWDTSGQQIFKDACASRLQKANCVIFVYSVNQQESIKDLLKFWIPKAIEYCADQIPFYLFGNKSDLIEDQNQKRNLKEQLQQKIKNQFPQRKDGFNLQHHSYIGSCLDQKNESLREMMAKIIQELYSITIRKEQKQEEMKKQAIKKGELPKQPQKPAIKLEPSTHKKIMKQEKKKVCQSF